MLNLSIETTQWWSMILRLVYVNALLSSRTMYACFNLLLIDGLQTYHISEITSHLAWYKMFFGCKKEHSVKLLLLGKWCRSILQFKRLVMRNFNVDTWTSANLQISFNVYLWAIRQSADSAMTDQIIAKCGCEQAFMGCSHTTL